MTCISIYLASAKNLGAQQGRISGGCYVVTLDFVYL